MRELSIPLIPMMAVVSKKRKGITGKPIEM
jgi:hypothetical protein